MLSTPGNYETAFWRPDFSGPKLGDFETCRKYKEMGGFLINATPEAAAAGVAARLFITGEAG